ncbi:MAG: hypothetical protein WA001_02030 [Patescibacteria group bacterium]
MTDDELKSFDLRGPFPAIQWLNRTLRIDPGHTGSESFADFFGLAGYHSNGTKAKRRRIARS